MVLCVKLTRIRRNRYIKNFCKWSVNIKKVLITNDILCDVMPLSALVARVIAGLRGRSRGSSFSL